MKTEADRAFEVLEAYLALNDSERVWFAHHVAANRADVLQLVSNLESQLVLRPRF